MSQSIKGIEGPVVRMRQPVNQHCGLASALPDVPMVRLHLGETLFSAGEKKIHLYRVEEGAIGITWSSPNGTPEPVEVVGRGEVFGTGMFKDHTCNAVAILETVVSCWPIDDFFQLAEHVPAASQRRAEETEREFYHRRESCIAGAGKEPYQTLAGFLLVTSQMNAREQRDALKIDDTIQSHAVAALLNIDIETLAKALLKLKQLGGIEESSTGDLYIRNPLVLERLAFQTEQSAKKDQPADLCH